MVATAIVYVKDLPRMRHFYESCFALRPAESEGDEFSVLVSDEWELWLVTMPADLSSAVVIDDPPARREGTPVKLAFTVGSLEGLAASVPAAGGRLDPPESAWEFRGHRLLDSLDPEGNVIQVRQLVTM